MTSLSRPMHSGLPLILVFRSPSFGHFEEACERVCNAGPRFSGVVPEQLPSHTPFVCLTPCRGS